MKRRQRGTPILAILSIIAGLSILSALQHKNQTPVIPSCSESIFEKQPAIPKLVHITFGLGDKKGVAHKYRLSSDFSFFNYVVLLAARLQIQPTTLFVHYYNEPTTFWWNVSKQDPEISMTLVKSRLIDTIFSKRVDHHSHRSDVLRLEVLLQHGGIYLDSDVLVHRSFDPLLNISDVVMAHEEDNKGLACNAVVLAKKNAAFLKRWYDAYQSYDAKCWSCHSVMLPARLAELYPDDIRVLPTEAFFRPGWSQLKQFEENTYDFTRNYASHFWNTVNEDAIKTLTPSLALKSKTTFGRMVRHAVGVERLRKLDQLVRNTAS